MLRALFFSVYYLWVPGVTAPPPEAIEKDRIDFHHDRVATDRFARELQLEREELLRLLYEIGYPPEQTHQRHYLVERLSRLLYHEAIQVYPLPKKYRDNAYPFHAFNTLHADYKKAAASNNTDTTTPAGQNSAGSPGARRNNTPEEVLPAIGPGNRPATLGPHDGQPFDGLHNQQWDNVDVKEDSFKTVKQVDMRNLSEDENTAKRALKTQGRSEEDIEQVIGSGNNFKAKPLQEGDKLYGFDTSTNKYGSKKQDSMYWLDEQGYQAMKKDYYIDGKWNKEGVKNYLSLPCMNRADVIDVATVTEDQQAIESTVGVAREQIGYTRDDYRTGMLGKIMPGGGKQITPDPSKTSAVTRLAGTP